MNARAAKGGDGGALGGRVHPDHLGVEGPVAFRPGQRPRAGRAAGPSDAPPPRRPERRGSPPPSAQRRLDPGAYHSRPVRATRSRRRGELGDDVVDRALPELRRDAARVAPDRRRELRLGMGRDAEHGQTRALADVRDAVEPHGAGIEREHRRRSRATPRGRRGPSARPPRARRSRNAYGPTTSATSGGVGVDDRDDGLAQRPELGGLGVPRVEREPARAVADVLARRPRARRP